MLAEVLKKLSVYSFQQKIAASDRLLFSGSCFSDEIGERCAAEGFDVLVNPGGTMFDPLSLERHFLRLLQPQLFSEEELFFHDGLYRNWDHYSKLGSYSTTQTLSKLNERYALASHYLKYCNRLFITFGSAWYYQLKSNGNAVCNCHKMPASLFEKKIISAAEIVAQWTALLRQLVQFNPQLKIVFTVSPVKHLRDGIIENSRSKAVLLDAVHQLVDKDICEYFPSYELVNDVLRDYRFYKADAAHPTEQAVDFVFDFFKEKVFGNQR
jgi:hypothetical protein